LPYTPVVYQASSRYEANPYRPFGYFYIKNRAFGVTKPGIVWPFFEPITTIYSLVARNILGTDIRNTGNIN